MEEMKIVWIPCSERLPSKNGNYLVTRGFDTNKVNHRWVSVDHFNFLSKKWTEDSIPSNEKCFAWANIEVYKGDLIDE